MYPEIGSLHFSPVLILYLTEIEQLHIYKFCVTCKVAHNFLCCFLLKMCNLVHLEIIISQTIWEQQIHQLLRQTLEHGKIDKMACLRRFLRIITAGCGRGRGLGTREQARFGTWWARWWPGWWVACVITCLGPSTQGWSLHQQGHCIQAAGASWQANFQGICVVVARSWWGEEGWRVSQIRSGFVLPLVGAGIPLKVGVEG